MRSCLLIFTMLFLVGCQRPAIVYDVPGSRSYDMAPADLWPRLVEALDAKDLTVLEANQASSRLTAVLIDYQPKGWAACKRARVVDTQSNSRRLNRGRPVDRELRLDVQLDEAGDGAEVTMQAMFSERQINPFRNLPFRVACPSTGDLERALFAAIG